MSSKLATIQNYLANSFCNLFNMKNLNIKLNYDIQFLNVKNT